MKPPYLLQFLNKVQSIFESPSYLHGNGSNKLLFRFEFTGEAALHNAIILQCYNFNLHLAMQNQKNSQVYYGSEFQYAHVLSSIFRLHPLWKYTESILSSSASFPLHPIPSGIRNEDIQFHKE